MRCCLVLHQDVKPQTLFLTWDSYRRNTLLCICRFVEFWSSAFDGLWETVIGYDCTVNATHRNTWSRVGVNGTFSDDFLVQVGLHQGSILSPFLLIIELGTLSSLSIRSAQINCFMWMTWHLLVTYLRDWKGDWKLGNELWS